MADIFISYARSDRDRIEKLAAALQAEGYSVWWDRELTGGEEFSKEIERELHAAKAVIVAWSRDGAASSWVRDEASLARSEQKLFPIRLDTEKPPLGFQQFHTFDFSGWKGARDAEPLKALIASIDKRTSAAPKAARAKDVRSESTRGIKPLYLAVGAIGAVVLVAASIFMLRGPDEGDVPAIVADSEMASPSDVAPAATSQGVIGLAVLPFVNMSADPEQEYFADGLTEELLNWLANVEGLNVPGRTTAFQFKGKTDDLRKIAADLNAQYLLEGSVRSSGDALRITAQLIEAETGYHLWSETYDRQLKDIFAIQDEVAREVVTELLGEIPESGMVNPASVGDVDPRAHELYLEGRALLSSAPMAQSVPQIS